MGLQLVDCIGAGPAGPLSITIVIFYDKTPLHQSEEKISNQQIMKKTPERVSLNLDLVQIFPRNQQENNSPFLQVKVN